jgi:hypothetical protein
MKPRPLSGAARNFVAASGFVEPASHRLFCVAVEFVGAAFRRAPLTLPLNLHPPLKL